MKTCSKCRETLPESDFASDVRATDGLCCYCKDCKRALNRDYQKRHRYHAYTPEELLSRDPDVWCEDVLKDHRERALTYRELAAVTGIPKSTLHEWNNEPYLPKFLDDPRFDRDVMAAKMRRILESKVQGVMTWTK